MKERRGQLIGHVFIFVLGAFVVASVMLVGYKALDNLNAQQCKAEEAEFARDIMQTFDSNMARGKVRMHTFSLPCSASEVCFVERNAIDQGTSGIGNLPQYPIIQNSVENNEPKSVWLLTDEGYTPVDGITTALPVDDFGSTPLGVQCFAGSDVELKLEGRGMSVEISRGS
jgi:hypothetical protein